MIDTQKNFDDIKSRLIFTKRDGVEELVDFLDTSDFKTAPASTKYHLCIEGGLGEHSLNVLKFARTVTQELSLDLSEDSVTIACLLHDLCKVNFYVLGETWDKEWKDKTNQWRKMKVWKIEDQSPLGHGEKSAIVASKYIDLKDDEIAAIRWHMLKWDSSDSNGRTMQDAMEKYPLVKVVAIADQLAEFYESTHKKYKLL